MHRVASLDVNNASSVGLDEQTFVLFEQGVQQYNTYLSKGLIKTPHISARVQSTTTSPNIQANCAGLSGFGYGGGSWDLYLNECQTVRIEALLAIAASVVGIVGILVEFIPVIGQVAGAALGIASSLIAIGAGVLLYTDASGGFNGLYMIGRYFRNGIAVEAYGAQQDTIDLNDHIFQYDR